MLWKSKSYFVTTPIYYANANPHIGHLYSSVIADAIQRWQCLVNKKVKLKFSTGTDEHGLKIQRAAYNKSSLPEYCSKISEQYKELSDKFSINYTDFIRTSDDCHKETVQKFWKVLQMKGHIYTSKYKGWYCISDETFLTESQLKEIDTKDGKKILVSEESGNPVEWTEEQNYMFKLSLFQNDILHWLKHNEDVVKPKKFYKILLDMASNEPLPDLSISRPSSRVHWGITVPDDLNHTVYVWLDALVNYLTVAGYHQSSELFHSNWPPDVHVIGKDILKFHGIYWPAFLMAADLEPFKCILCHSHWTVNSEKMSKSKNNVVCPFKSSDLYTSDGLRYFLLREGVAHSDGNYSDTKVIRILNSEMADTLGNLLSRCTGKALNPDQVFPEIKPEALESVSSLDVTKNLMLLLEDLPGICKHHYGDYNFYKVVDFVMATLHSANLFFETLKPWELKKSEKTSDELKAVLHISMEALRVAGVLLKPIIPNIAERLLTKLNIPEDDRYFASLINLSWKNPEFKSRSLTPDKIVLFRRIMTEAERKKQKA